MGINKKQVSESGLVWQIFVPRLMEVGHFAENY
jgi:hypothetical protein